VAPQRGPVPAPPRPRKSSPVPASKQLKRQAASQPGPTLAKPNGQVIIGGELGHARPVPAPPTPPTPLIAATQPPLAAWPTTAKPPFKSAPTGKSATTATTAEVSPLSIRGAGGFLPPQPHEIISLTKPIAVFETSGGGKPAKAEVKTAAVEKANGERGVAVATTTSTEKAVRSTFVAALADNYLELENGLRSEKDADRKKGGRATEAAQPIPRGDGGSKGGSTSLKDKEQNGGGVDYGDTIFMKEPTVGQLTLSTYEVAEATRRPPPQTNKEASLIALPLSAANKGAPLIALPLSAASTASGPVRLTSDIFVDYLEEEEEGDGGGDSRETASPPIVVSSSVRPFIQPKRYQGSNARQQTPRPLPPAVQQTPRPLPPVRQWADTRASVEQQSGKA
jgi:hypothetical protein